MVEALLPAEKEDMNNSGSNTSSLPPVHLTSQISSSSITSTTTSSKRRSRKRTISHTPHIEDAREFGDKRKPHRIPDELQPSGYRLARVGEMKDETTGAPAEKYHIFKTPLQSLDEFGVGISLYFRQLMVLSIIFLICGIVSIPAIYHNTSFNPPDTSLLAKGENLVRLHVYCCH